MQMHKGVLGGLVVLMAMTSLSFGQKNLTDPYEILQASYKAAGGLDKFKAQKTRYIEGDLSIVGTGLQGTFKRWEMPPLRQRQELDLTIFKQTSGDNGEYAWSVDANGKLQIRRDEKTLKKRQLQKLVDEYQFLDRNSPYFNISLEGTDTVGDATCYVVKMANTINDEVTTTYYDVSTFRSLKTVLKEPDQTTTTLQSDYRKVDGIEMPFHQDIEIAPIGQRQTVQLTKYESNIPIDTSIFQPPSKDVADFRFLKGGDSVVVPFQYIEGHIYMMVNIEGKERLWILDSGAGMTIADSSFIADIGLTAEGNLKGQGAGNTVQVSFVTLPSYRVSDIEFEQQKVGVINLNQLFHRIIGLDIAGILGYDFLSRFVTKIDYAGQELTIYLPDSFTYTGTGKLMDAPLKGNFFGLPLSVDNEYSGTWNLDLGANGLSFHYPYAEEHGLLDRPGISHVSFGAGGSMEGRISRFKTVELAGYVVPDLVVDIPLQKGMGAFASKELVGNIGNDLFRHFTLYLDYKRQQVAVEKGGDFDKVFPYDRSGVQFWYDDNDQVEVFFVAPGTPGEKAGLKKGDKITSINGIDVTFFDGLIPIRKLMREKVGTVYEFGTVRDGTPRTVQLTLAKIL